MKDKEGAIKPDPTIKNKKPGHKNTSDSKKNDPERYLLINGDRVIREITNNIQTGFSDKIDGVEAVLNDLISSVVVAEIGDGHCIINSKEYLRSYDEAIPLSEFYRFLPGELDMRTEKKG